MSMAGERLREKAAEIRRRAARDARRGTEEAKERSKAAAQEVKQRAKQDAKAAERAVSKQSAKDVARAAGAAAKRLEQAGGGAAPSDSGGNKEVMQKAENAARVRAPLDATLDPGTDGGQMEAFVTASEPTMDEQASDDRPDDATLGVDAAFVMGSGSMDGSFFSSGDAGGDAMGGDAGGGGGDDGDPLAFDDTFGVTGGDE